jgi:hypothetical protein
MSLLRLAELSLVARKGRERSHSFWDDFMSLATEAAVLPSAYPALLLTERLCPGTVPAQVLTAGEMKAPAAMLHVVQCLRPANAQSVLRCSLQERFMWTSSIPRLLWQIFFELFTIQAPMRDRLRIYRTRIWRIICGTLTRRAPDGF